MNIKEILLTVKRLMTKENKCYFFVVVDENDNANISTNIFKEDIPQLLTDLLSNTRKKIDEPIHHAGIGETPIKRSDA